MPKYKCGDSVSFTLEGTKVEGTVAIVDPYGTFENPNEVSYDILGSWNGVETLFKHITEKSLCEN